MSVGTAVAQTDHTLWVGLHQTSVIVNRERIRELALIGISGLEAAVLSALEDSSGTATPMDISKWTQREPRATARLLRRMEAKGLITRTSRPDRSNPTRIRTTRTGRKVYEDSLKGEGIQRVISSLSETEKQELEVVLKAVLLATLDKSMSSSQQK